MRLGGPSVDFVRNSTSCQTDLSTDSTRVRTTTSPVPLSAYRFPQRVTPPHDRCSRTPSSLPVSGLIVGIGRYPVKRFCSRRASLTSSSKCRCRCCTPFARCAHSRPGRTPVPPSPCPSLAQTLSPPPAASRPSGARSLHAALQASNASELNNTQRTSSGVLWFSNSCQTVVRATFAASAKG